MPIRHYPVWRIEALGDRCLMVSFEARVDPAINEAVHALASDLLAQALPGVTDVVPAFTTVAVHWRPVFAGGGASVPVADRVESCLRHLLAQGFRPATETAREVVIPVCYGGEFGPDLAEVAQVCGLSEAEVIARHAASPHRVYMLGFAPGFPYLGGLDAGLAMPRRATPRVTIPAGTVAIAREQSAIYTLETPGGWNLIGRTPVELFTPHAASPTVLQPGDRVRFEPVPRERYEALARKVGP